MARLLQGWTVGTLEGIRGLANSAPQVGNNELQGLEKFADLVRTIVVKL